MKKSDKAGEMVINLSELMRFMLKEGQNKFIPASKEIHLIENYVDLELLRFGEHLKVTNYINDDYLVGMTPPLLFFSLIENSFKHGVSYLGSNNFIHYELNGNEEYLIFKVENSISKKVENHNAIDHGIGLKNLMRQLELIYGDNYVFQQVKKSDSFVSTLKIPNNA